MRVMKKHAARDAAAFHQEDHCLPPAAAAATGRPRSPLTTVGRVPRHCAALRVQQ